MPSRQFSIVACGQTMLPDKSIFSRTKIYGKCQIWKNPMQHFGWFSNSVLKCCKIGASFAKTTTRWDWPRRLLIDLDWEKRETQTQMLQPFSTYPKNESSGDAKSQAYKKYFLCKSWGDFRKPFMNKQLSLRSIFNASIWMQYHI